MIKIHHTSAKDDFLIKEERSVIFGDACGPGTLVMEEFSTDISTYLKSLLRLKSREDEYDAGNRAVLHLEPGLAFGSGTHDTTRLCLETLEKYAYPGKTVLDVGCGSGILSVASLLLGADSAVGVDIDALAVKTAKENGVTNGFDEPKFTVLKGSTTDKVTGKFDIIAANIVADIIIGLCKNVKDFMNPGAIFITSGIIVPREEDVLAAFAENGLEVIARHESGGWLCFEAKAAE